MPTSHCGDHERSVRPETKEIGCKVYLVLIYLGQSIVDEANELKHRRKTSLNVLLKADLNVFNLPSLGEGGLGEILF